MKPKRIQRKRTKDWRMPHGAVYIGRPSKWGNPYKEGEKHPDHGFPMSRDEAVGLHEKSSLSWSWEKMNEIVTELRGKDLACWCKERESCHGDVLLKIANGRE